MIKFGAVVAEGLDWLSDWRIGYVTRLSPKLPVTAWVRFPRKGSMWDGLSGHQVGQVGFPRVLRFPPTLRSLHASICAVGQKISIACVYCW